MRARYSAFVLNDVDVLLSTWHRSTRPAGLAPDPTRRWTGLEVVESSGGLFDSTGVVEFRAHHDGGVQHERSRFTREGGRWWYLDGVVLDG